MGIFWAALLLFVLSTALSACVRIFLAEPMACCGVLFLFWLWNAQLSPRIAEQYPYAQEVTMVEGIPKASHGYWLPTIDRMKLNWLPAKVPRRIGVARTPM